MIATTFDGTSVFLLPYEPDWPSLFSGSFDEVTTLASGLSQREEREPLAAKLRAALKYKAVLDTDQADDLRDALAAWDNRPVLCPFWPAQSLVGHESAASVQGALRVWFEPDWSTWEIGDGIAPIGMTPSSECLTAPLVWGRFDALPVPRIVDGHNNELVSISIIETGSVDYALVAKTGSLTNSTSVNGETVPLLQTEHGFGWGSNTHTIDVRIARERVGFGRGEVDSFTPQTPRSRQVMEFDWLEQADAAYLLRLFVDRSGSVSPFWAVASHSLTDQVYGRFAADRLTIEWDLPASSGERASCKVEFITLPTEQTIPDGETFGETIGPQAARWFGYVITDGAITWRATSYESAIAGPGGTYTPRKITHGKIIEEINIPVNECTITVEHWANGPFGRLITNPRSLALVVTIYEGLISAPSDAEIIFTGTANTPKAKGAKLSLKLSGLGSLASIEGPRSVLTKDCVAVFGDVRCGKDLAALRVTADLLSFADGVAKIDATAADYEDNYFADGYIDRAVDSMPQRYLISASYDFGDGKLALALIGDVLPAVTGAEVDWILTPGCDGLFATCKNRWANVDNFRGFPYLPNDNPTIPALPQAAATGKK